MFIIDATSNKDYFLILKNGKEFVRVSKAANKLDAVMKYFQINVIKGV